MTGKIFFFAGFNPNSDTSPPEDPSLQENPNEEEKMFDLELHPKKITKYQDAIAALEDYWIAKDSLRRQQNFHPQRIC